MSKVYIYCLIDPRDNMIRYVGKTVNLKNRYNYHLNCNLKDTNTHKKNWINSLKYLELKPELFILDEIHCNDKEWIQYEMYWISQIRSWGFNLLNYSIGGDNPPVNNKPTPTKTKLKMSNSSPNRKTIDVFSNDEYIGRFVGINNFIRDFFGYDRYENPKEFNICSSKIASVLSGKRKTHKKLHFKYVN